MSKVHVGKEALETAWKRHESLGRNNAATDTHILILLYAVECSLNCCLMARDGVHHTSKLSDDRCCPHKIDWLANELNAPHIRGYRAEKPKDEYISPENLHSLFRYGGRLTKSDRNHLRNRLLDDWARENHP